MNLQDPDHQFRYVFSFLACAADAGNRSAARQVKFRLVRAIALSSLMVILLPTFTRAQFTKTIQVVPKVQVNAVTTWYYLNCDTSLGLGSYTVNVAPTNGTLAFGDINGIVPGCPPSSPLLPAAVAYYTWTETTSTATSDYFQLDYFINGQLGEVLDITVLRTVPQILFGNKNVTGTTQQVAVGQQINLSGIPSSTAQPVEWTVDGNPIGGFQVSGCPSGSDSSGPVSSDTGNCTGAVLPPPDFGQSSVTFYWTVSGNYGVTYKFVLDDGTVSSVNATFDVIGPQFTDLEPSAPGITSLLPPKSPIEVSCGEISLTGFSKACTIFPIEIAPFAAYPGSHPLFVQLISFDTDDVVSSDGHKFLCSPGTGLDSSYPYSAKELHNGEVTASWDALSWYLSLSAIPEELIFEDIHFSARMYVLWTSGLQNAIPVPLEYSDWTWEAIAARHVGGMWQLKSGPRSATINPYVETSTYPEWDSLAAADQYQCTPLDE